LAWEFAGGASRDAERALFNQLQVTAKAVLSRPVGP
jgi:hypothetical protein